MSSEPIGEVHRPKPTLSVFGDPPSTRLRPEEGHPEAGTPGMQLHAARTFARCVNALEEEPLFDLLAPDVTFLKQRLTASFSYRGKARVIQSIKEASETARRHIRHTYPRFLTAELGRMATPGLDTTGVIGWQNGHRCTFWSFLFDRSGKIKSIRSHRHSPDPNKAEGFEEWPGLPEGELLRSKRRWLRQCRGQVWLARTHPFHPLIFWTFGSSPEELAKVFGLYMIDLPTLFPAAQLRGQVIPSEITDAPGTYGEQPWDLYSKMGLHSLPAVAVQLGQKVIRYGLGPYQPDDVYQELASIGLRPDVEV